MVGSGNIVVSVRGTIGSSNIVVGVRGMIVSSNGVAICWCQGYDW